MYLDVSIELLQLTLECILTFSLTVTLQTPSLNASVSDVNIEAGTPVTLTCTTGSSGASMSYIFLKDSNLVVIEPTRNYMISSPTSAESGDYTCVVKIDGVESPASNIHTLTVVGKTFRLRTRYI